jgi:hypothetical protein
MKRCVTRLALGTALAGLLAAAGCSTPSERYGLAPPSENTAEYPNINIDPAKKSAQSPMTPAQRAEAEAELERRAGRKPKAAAPKPN